MLIYIHFVKSCTDADWSIGDGTNHSITTFPFWLEFIPCGVLFYSFVLFIKKTTRGFQAYHSLMIDTREENQEQLVSLDYFFRKVPL